MIVTLEAAGFLRVQAAFQLALALGMMGSLFARLITISVLRVGSMASFVAGIAVAFLGTLVGRNLGEKPGRPPGEQKLVAMMEELETLVIQDRCLLHCAHQMAIAWLRFPA